MKEWAYFDNGKDKPVGKSLLEIFDLGSSSGLTEVLFLERCINLLKPGGRMGIVLPEGILNNPKMQKVRNYIESKAKIINITSIPQDVFIASGAMVSTSLLFFKKFTEEEEKRFNDIKEKATKSANRKYKDEILALETNLKSKKLSIEVKKKTKNKLAEILKNIEEEIRIDIKTNFEYEIPIIEVQDAGITSTGTPSGNNELKPIAETFKKYRLKNKLWNEYTNNN